MKTKFGLLVLATALLPAGAREIRELRNVEGKTIQAEVLDLSEGQLKIRSNGRVFQVPLEKLSPEDQTWLAQWNANRAANPGGADYSEAIFKDDFSGEGFGERWTHYKSGSRVKDGVFLGITPPDSDHQAVDTIKFEGRRDLEISLKFKFSTPQAQRFALKFDDTRYKGSHAGHICRVTITRTNVTLSDDKTGVFKNEIFERKQPGGGLDAETKKLLATKSAQFPLDLKNDQWHELLLRTQAERMTVTIDGNAVGELVSEGIAHTTKSVVGMATPGEGVCYDDFIVNAAPESGGTGQRALR